MNKTPYAEEINSLDHTMRHYFAAANTHEGFVSLFPEIFDPNILNTIYILKGGPGVGKSTLMKNAARAALSAGLTPICYHCSSDPASLDGVLIVETGKAILDGTAPHVVDPCYAGVKEVVVNLGEAWDRESLAAHGEEIIALSRKKSICYKTAYRLLAAAKQADDELFDMGRCCLNRQKMQAAIERFAAKHFKKGGEGKTVRAVTDAISCDGAMRFFTPEKQARTLYFVKDARSTARLFFGELYQAARRAGVETEVGIRPLSPDQYTYLYFPQASVCVSLYDDEFCGKLDNANREYKLINLGRFFDAERFKCCRGRYRFTEKCAHTLCEAAYEELAQAGRYHAKMEEFYGSCTDYDIVTHMSENVIADVIK